MNDLGVVVLAHGSRVEETLATLAQVAEQVDRAGPWLTEAATLQFNEPSLEQAVDKLIGRGVRQVVVLPFFLFDGAHVRSDIPRLLEAISTKHNIPVSLGRHVGFDYRLGTILIERLAEVVGPNLVFGEAKFLPPGRIEEESFSRIRSYLDLAAANGLSPVVERVVHASGDLSIASLVFASPRALSVAQGVLAGAQVFTDVKMVAAGINKRRLAALGSPAPLCFIDDKDVMTEAATRGTTRAAAAVAKLAEVSPEAVVVIGNAPTALREVIRLNGIGRLKTPLVIGMPVGFVDAAESKEALSNSPLEHIGIRGTRGGSSLAAATVNALMGMAGE